MLDKKRYLIIFTIGAFATFSMLPLFNFVVDQWRVLSEDSKACYQGIEPNKNFLKVQYLLRHKTDHSVLLMGSSRIGNLDSKLVGEDAYNMTYSFGLLRTHLSNLKILLAHGVKIKHIYLGLNDYILFKKPSDFARDYLRKAYPDNFIDKIEFYRFYLFKKPAVRDLEILTGRKYKLVATNEILAPHNMKSRRNREKRLALHQNSHAKKIRNYKPILLGYNERFRTNKALSEIKEFKQFCVKNNIKLTVFIYPQFFTSYLSYDQFEMEKFKRQLSNIIDFYDFYTLDDYAFDELKWFDTSHFVPSIGDDILGKIHLEENLVTSENVNRRLKEARSLISLVLEKAKLDKCFKFNYKVPLDCLTSLFTLSSETVDQVMQIRTSITFENEKMIFKAGRDPFIILPSLMSQSKNVIFSCKLFSSKKNMLTLFYRHDVRKKYAERNTITVPLKKGMNEFNILIPAGFIHNRLRIDYVRGMGYCNVYKMVVLDV